jgi:hypothetical protein
MCVSSGRAKFDLLFWFAVKKTIYLRFLAVFSSSEEPKNLWKLKKQQKFSYFFIISFFSKDRARQFSLRLPIYCNKTVFAEKKVWFALVSVPVVVANLRLNWWWNQMFGALFSIGREEQEQTGTDFFISDFFCSCLGAIKSD